MFRLDVVWDSLPWLLQGLVVTIELSLLAIVLAAVLGLVLAIARHYGPWPVRLMVRCHVDVMRGTPILVQILLLYYVLPKFGLELGAFSAGVIALGLNSSAYVAEILRSGFLSVPISQVESGYALGLSTPQVLRRILLPQLFGLVLPPMTGEFAKLIKASSIVSVIAIVELTRAGQRIIATTFSPLEIYGTVGLLYLSVSLVLFFAAARAEQWATRYR